jgi:hypothetical protein
MSSLAAFPAMRVAGWLGLLTVVPLIAGCFGGDPAPEESTTATSTFGVTVGRPQEPKPPRLTNTLHFLDAQTLSTVAPDSYEPLRIPIYSPLAQPGSTRLTLWNFTWPADVSAIRGVLHLTVEIQGTVAGSPYTATSDGDFCFWVVYIEVYDPAANAIQRDERGNTTPCGEEPAIVPEGVRRLELPFELPGTSFATGDIATIQISAESYGQAPDARVDLLTGSITKDSTITFEGVGWPEGLEQVTLLTTT